MLGVPTSFSSSIQPTNPTTSTFEAAFLPTQKVVPAEYTGFSALCGSPESVPQSWLKLNVPHLLSPM